MENSTSYISLYTSKRDSSLFHAAVYEDQNASSLIAHCECIAI